jgi:excinuclease ABC subunit B
MYADTVTDSMQKAIDETNRRRAKQVAYNKEHGIDPTPLRKKIADITDLIVKEVDDTEDLMVGSHRSKAVIPGFGQDAKSLPRQELIALIDSLTEQMKSAAAQLQFEVAARLRDEIRELKKELRAMIEAGN